MGIYCQDVMIGAVVVFCFFSGVMMIGCLVGEVVRNVFLTQHRFCLSFKCLFFPLHVSSDYYILWFVGNLQGVKELNTSLR